MKIYISSNCWSDAIWEVLMIMMLPFLHTPTNEDAFICIINERYDDYVCMIMWLAECVCCDTPPKSGASAVHGRDGSGAHCRAVFGQSIRWPHDNPRFLRHARKPVPVHIIMHCAPQIANCTWQALVKQVQVGEAVCNSVHASVSIRNIIWLKLLPRSDPSYNRRDVVICERNIKHDICSSAPSTVSGQLWPGRHRPVLRLLLLSHLLHRLWQLCQCRAKPSTEGGTQGPKRRAGGGKKRIQSLTF